MLAKDRANTLNARNQWKRVDELFKQGIMSQQDDDLAKANVDAADAQVASDLDQSPFQSRRSSRRSIKLTLPKPSWVLRKARNFRPVRYWIRPNSILLTLASPLRSTEQLLPDAWMLARP